MANAIIETHSGIAFDYLAPTSDMITLEDISWALSLQCRYAGHTRAFYSVAEHSLLVSNALEHMGYDREIVLAGLLHDAAEAYVSDIPGPLKALLPDFEKIETRVAKAIADKFGLLYPFPKEVKEVDKRIVTNERTLLTRKKVEVPNEPYLLPNIIIRGLRPLEAAIAFNEKANELLHFDRYMIPLSR